MIIIRRFDIAAIAVFIGAVFSGAALAGLDSDSDGVPDSSDNCSEVSNPDQRNTDGDAYGNICDPDFTQDDVVNLADLNYMRNNFFTADPDADLDGSGLANLADLNIMRRFFFKAPGPGATAVVVGYAADVEPILGVKCANCHTGDNDGGHDIGSDYSHAFLPAIESFLGTFFCPGLNVGQCSIVLIQNGSMPQDVGCTGNPAVDAGNNNCLTQAEQDTVQAWIDGGLQP